MKSNNALTAPRPSNGPCIACGNPTNGNGNCFNDNCWNSNSNRHK